MSCIADILILEDITKSSLFFQDFQIQAYQTFRECHRSGHEIFKQIDFDFLKFSGQTSQDFQANRPRLSEKMSQDFPKFSGKSILNFEANRFQKKRIQEIYDVHHMK